MDSLQSIKSRLYAVKNIRQIAKAMEMVAAVKMRKSQEIALRTRPYAFKALELLGKLSFFAPLETELTKKRQIKKNLIIVISSDRGLAGSFNTQVFRRVEQFVAADKYFGEAEQQTFFATVGKKAEKFILEKNWPLIKSFSGFSDFIDFAQVKPLTNFLIDGFKKEQWDRVTMISMHFRTALLQEPRVRQILPVDFEKIKETVKEIAPEYGKYADLKYPFPSTLYPVNVDYLFEPSPKETLETLIPHLVEMQVYHLVLEANASEHSARRAAMKAACDNADNLSKVLTIQYNKARQASITKEVVEITATQSALT
jgi:F-type H+-transporting ATPase subunit gamma